MSTDNFDELMDARLSAAGQRWRAANADNAQVVPAAGVDVPGVPAPHVPLRRRWPAIASAAVIVGALVAGGAWFATRPDRAGRSLPAGQTTSPTGAPSTYGGLTGVTWKVFTISQEAPAAGNGLDTTNTTAEFRIEADGTVNGSDGCNHYSGRATITDSTLTFGDLAVTAMGCLDTNVSGVAAVIDKILQGEVAWTISDSGASNSLFLQKTGVGSITLFGAKPPNQTFAETKIVGRWQLSQYSQENAGSGSASSSGSGSASGVGSSGGFDSFVAFDGAGHFSTDERCYSTAGDVVFDGSVGTFSGTHGTRAIPCPATPDQAEEQARTTLVDNMLSGRATLTLEANGDLTIANGGVTLTFVRASTLTHSGAPTS